MQNTWAMETVRGKLKIKELPLYKSWFHTCVAFITPVCASAVWWQDQLDCEMIGRSRITRIYTHMKYDDIMYRTAQSAFHGT